MTEAVPTPSERLATNVQLLRRSLIGSQDALAERMAQYGWVRSTVAKIELGQRKVTVDELVALAALFDVSVDALLSQQFTVHATPTEENP